MTDNAHKVLSNIFLIAAIACAAKYLSVFNALLAMFSGFALVGGNQ